MLLNVAKQRPENYALYQIKRADMAQLVERTLGKGEVPSSTLGISTTF